MDSSYLPTVIHIQSTCFDLSLVEQDTYDNISQIIQMYMINSCGFCLLSLYNDIFFLTVQKPNYNFIASLLFEWVFH